MWPKEEEVEGVVEGEAEAGPGVAAVVVLAHLGAEVVAVEVAGGEDTRGVVGAEGEAEEVEEEGACKLLGANIPCAILVRNFVVVKCQTQFILAINLILNRHLGADIPE